MGVKRQLDPKKGDGKIQVNIVYTRVDEYDYMYQAEVEGESDNVDLDWSPLI